jgi:hypothetical protein
MLQFKSLPDLPMFCSECSNSQLKIFSGKVVCKKKCKYNPISRFDWEVLFKSLQG